MKTPRKPCLWLVLFTYALIEAPQILAAYITLNDKVQAWHSPVHLIEVTQPGSEVQ